MWLTQGERKKFLIILGGGKVGYYLARALSELKHKVTVIESTKNRCINIAIARVSNPKNIKIFEQLGVNAAVSSTASIVDIIEREVFISGLKSLGTVGNLSVNEIKLLPNYYSVNKQIRDLEFPKDCIIISIIRNNDVIIPGGSTKLLSGDEVITVSKKGTEEIVENVLGKI